MTTPPFGASPQARRERAINAPPGVVIVVASILGGYLLQSLAPDPDAVLGALGLSSQGLRSGRLWTLVSVVVVHGGWMHAVLNALGALAFGAPVARRLGGGAKGAARFLGFYLLCGALASAGYVVMHWTGTEVLVGASGAISGLMGASSRLLDRDPTGRGTGFAPLTSRTVIGMALAWGVINLLMAMRWVDVGAGAPVAWEAHLFGYAAGLLLIAPLARLAPRPVASLQHPSV